MNREPSEFCRHALAEFAFLAENGFSESHTVGDSHFSIEYRSMRSHLIGVGAFLPRYEYDVSLAHKGNHCDLHELAVILNTAEPGSPNWTWAHSVPTVFSQHITYSAALLRKLLPEFLGDDGTFWERVLSRRARMSTEQHHIDQLKLADAAFCDGRWGDAIAIYESAPNRTPVQDKRLGIAKHRFK